MPKTPSWRDCIIPAETPTRQPETPESVRQLITKGARAAAKAWRKANPDGDPKEYHRVYSREYSRLRFIYDREAATCAKRCSYQRHREECIKKNNDYRSAHKDRYNELARLRWSLKKIAKAQSRYTPLMTKP